MGKGKNQEVSTLKAECIHFSSSLSKTPKIEQLSQQKPHTYIYKEEKKNT